VINADLNGAIGILRKVIDESLFKEIVNRGFVINPNKINIYSVK
jgi:phosphotransferase system IIA component